MSLNCPALHTTFDEFFSRINLSYFAEFEISKFFYGRLNTEPEPDLWLNIVATMVIADVAREELGKPLTITGSYRSFARNRAIKASKRSNHQAFTALDTKVRGMTGYELASYYRAQRGRWYDMPFEFSRVMVACKYGRIPFRRLEHRISNGVFQVKFAGGVGGYETFAHLDTRGLNHSWTVK